LRHLLEAQAIGGVMAIAFASSLVDRRLNMIGLGAEVAKSCYIGS